MISFLFCLSFLLEAAIIEGLPLANSGRGMVMNMFRKEIDTLPMGQRPSVPEGHFKHGPMNRPRPENSGEDEEHHLGVVHQRSYGVDTENKRISSNKSTYTKTRYEELLAKALEAQKRPKQVPQRHHTKSTRQNTSPITPAPPAAPKPEQGPSPIQVQIVTLNKRTEMFFKAIQKIREYSQLSQQLMRRMNLNYVDLNGKVEKLKSEVNMLKEKDGLEKSVEEKLALLFKH